MPTEMPLNEPGPSGYTPYDYAADWAARAGRAQAAVDALGAGRPQPAPVPTPTEDQVRAAVVAVLLDALPTRDAYQTWDRNLLAYDLAGRITAGVLAVLGEEDAR